MAVPGRSGYAAGGVCSPEGGGDVATGIEPLYAWLRLSVAHVDPIRAPEKFSFGIQLSRVHYDVNSTVDDSMFFLVVPKKAPLANSLSSRTLAADKGAAGLRVEEGPNAFTRLLVLPGGDGATSFSETGTNSGIYRLKVELPVRTPICSCPC
jgi:hypothetical protein